MSHCSSDPNCELGASCPDRKGLRPMSAEIGSYIDRIKPEGSKFIAIFWDKQTQVGRISTMYGPFDTFAEATEWTMTYGGMVLPLLSPKDLGD